MLEQKELCVQGKAVSPTRLLTQGSCQSTMAAQGSSRQAFWDVKQPEKLRPLADPLQEEMGILCVFLFNWYSTLFSLK